MEEIIAAQAEMKALVTHWGNINSYSQNRAGLERMCGELKSAFSTLQPDILEEITLPNGPALFLAKRPEAPIQVYFGGHFDTVFPPSDWQVSEKGGTLYGPGICDMKGGLVILLFALRSLENSPAAQNIGWRMVLNPDEEIGSPYSTPLIQEKAQGCDLGLIFEPCLPDGSLVSARKGSANYKAEAHGKAAHIGREPEEGRCAIRALTRFICALNKLDKPNKGHTVKVGTMEGGSARNIVADHAECQINVRTFDIKTFAKLDKKLHQLAKIYGVTLVQLTNRPPKPFDGETKALFELLQKSARKLQINLEWQPSGGVCDGNILDIPTIDTLGAHGGLIHTREEYLHVESLAKRACLTSLFLTELGGANATGCQSTSCGCRA